MVRPDPRGGGVGGIEAGWRHLWRQCSPKKSSARPLGALWPRPPTRGVPHIMRMSPKCLSLLHQSQVAGARRKAGFAASHGTVTDFRVLHFCSHRSVMPLQVETHHVHVSHFAWLQLTCHLWAFSWLPQNWTLWERGLGSRDEL